nr:hypothetical protein [Candidatus Sigynarchaeota archaeon]
MERIIKHPTHLLAVAFEMFPDSPYRRDPTYFLPDQQKYGFSFLQFEHLFYGFSGELGITFFNDDGRASYVGLKRGYRDIQVRETQNLYLLEMNGPPRIDFKDQPREVVEFLRGYVQKGSS